MTAQILPFDGVQRARFASASDMPGGAPMSHKAILFARGLAQVEREISAKIAQGRTADAIMATGDLVALMRLAMALSPACVERALAASERAKAAIDASIGGRPTFDNADDPA
ncbi:MAG: hypothetical protein QM651_02205 [Rhodoblastus sp.]